MCPQSGEDVPGSAPTRYGVPGPAQDTACPSPIDHSTAVGVAIAVAVTPGTETDAATGAQSRNHSQVGR
ncbi:hypothetical protein [Alloactinosynnema sp. L-07]|nr:hypothetical protein [Alloactinosynnema sp. L-07]